jgi:predicted DNA binding CopG/RHH family protein
MSKDSWDKLLDQDWSAVWETLPEAPSLSARPKTTQVTLRVPASLLGRVKRVAAVRSLPYHTLARSWIAEGLRASVGPEPGSSVEEPQTEQINLKVDQGLLDDLKARGDQLRRPYHSLARDWIEAALGREENSLGLELSPDRQPAMKDLIVLLLHSTNRSGQDAIRGITQLQKLLFVVEQKMASDSHFYAYNYGPFNEEVNDAARALKLGGFIRSAMPLTLAPPSFAEMMATVVERSGPRDEVSVEEFALTERGHQAAERLRQSSRAYDQLFSYLRSLRQEWDTPQLLDRVYENWPKYAERSLIRDQVARRRSRRSQQ